MKQIITEIERERNKMFERYAVSQELLEQTQQAVKDLQEQIHKLRLLVRKSAD